MLCLLQKLIPWSVTRAVKNSGHFEYKEEFYELNGEYKSQACTP